MVQFVTKNFGVEELQATYNITSKFSIQVEGPASKIERINRRMIARIVFGNSIQQYGTRSRGKGIRKSAP